MIRVDLIRRVLRDGYLSPMARLYLVDLLTRQRWRIDSDEHPDLLREAIDAGYVVAHEVVDPDGRPVGVEHWLEREP